MQRKKCCILFCFILVLLIVAGGCTSPAGVQPESGSGPKPGEASPEQVLKVAIGSDINTWDIDKFPAGDTRLVWAQIYETLVRLDTDLNMIPGLAESWEPQDGGKVWVFHLRKDVLFHDGTPFNADAVLYSYADRAYVTEAATLELEGIETLDEYTVKFICKRPMPLPTYLTHVAWPVVSPTSVDAAGVFIQPIGTGPFRFVKYTKGQEVVMERFEDYWGGKEKLEEVIFKIIPDATTRMMALSAGDVDMSIKVPESEVNKLEQDSRITVHRKLTTFTDFMHFNCARQPVDDVNVRRAIAYALDTEGIVKNILGGIGVAARGRAYSPTMMYSSKNLPLYSHDLEKAKSILADAGWTDQDGNGVLEKDGKELSIDLILSPAPNLRPQKIAEACQAQLTEAGFKVNVKQMESAAVEQLENKGDFDIMMSSGMFVWGPYPHHVKIHHSKNYKSHYHNPAYDQLVIEGETELDEAKKMQIYEEIQKIILEEVPAFYIVHQQKIVATRSNVRGYEITGEEPWLNLKGIELVI